VNFVGRLSQAQKEFKREFGMTPVEFVRKMRIEGEKKGIYDKYFKQRQTS
jgi:methylphosphotriester-DNA--protein-cysteine methyltransferase